MGILNELLVKIGADIGPLKDQLSKANDKLDSFHGLTQKAAKGLGVLAAVGGIGKIASEIAQVALAAGRQAEEIAQLSQATGQSTASLQAWDVMLNRVGMTQADLAMGMKTLAQQVEQARAGVGSAGDRFRQLGIDITKLKTSDEFIRAIAESVSKMGGGMEKSAVMTDLMGRMGQRLIPAFDGGAKAIDEAAAASKRMTELSGEQLDRLGKMDDAVDDAGKAWTRLGQQLGAVVSPSIQLVANGLEMLASGAAQGLKVLDTALDTLSIRLTHLIMAGQALGQLFSSGQMFSGDAWKHAIDNIKLVDAEAAKLIAKRRALADAPGASDTRALPPAMVDSGNVAGLNRAVLDAQVTATAAATKQIEEQWKASNAFIAATWEAGAQSYRLTTVEIAEAQAAMSAANTAHTRESLIRQIQAHNDFSAKQIALTQAGSKERATAEGQAAAKTIDLWGQVVTNEIKGDTERLNSATAVAKAKQDLATKEAESWLAGWQLKAAAMMREKQLYTDQASAALEMIKVVQSARVSQFQDHQAILNATLNALRAEEDKELADVRNTEEEKDVIRQQYHAKRVAAEQQTAAAIKAARQSELSDLARVADAQFNLTKAQADHEFSLSRDAEAVRAAKVTALEAQYQADLQAAGDNANARLAIEANHQAQMISVGQQFPTFWQQQLKTVVDSNTFSVGMIVSSWTSGLANAIVNFQNFGQTMTQIGKQTATTLLQGILNFGVQAVAEWALQAASATTIKSAEAAAVVGINTAKNAAIVAGDAVTAGTTVSIWSAAGAAITGTFGTITGAIMGLFTAILIPAFIKIGTALMTFLTAIAAAAEATIFGIPYGVMVMAGVAVIGAAIGTLAAFTFAKGGIVTGPTMGMIGEAGSSEAVIPLNRHGAGFMAQMLGVGGGQGQTIQNRIYLDGREIAMAMTERQPSALRLIGAMP